MAKVIITPKAQKQFTHLPPSEQAKIKKKLALFGTDPLVGKILSGELSDLRSLKAWPYRIIYYIEKDTVYITSILHRQGAYQ
jgi:mRNA-degrading endonuclease RelE of RelBE toxin-antitoxin system